MFPNPHQNNDVRLPLFLILLIGFLIFYPYFHQKYQYSLLVLETFFTGLMISGISFFIHKFKLLILMIFLAALVLSGIWISGYIENFTILFLIMLIELFFFILIFIILLEYIFFQEDVNINSLYSAVTSYLVLGIIFAILYTLIEIIFPGSFKNTTETSTDLQIFPHPDFFIEALYFSFVTLSTLGFGDWIPNVGPVKMIAALQAILGQLYLVVLIARLVSQQRIKNDRKVINKKEVAR